MGRDGFLPRAGARFAAAPRAGLRAEAARFRAGFAGAFRAPVAPFAGALFAFGAVRLFVRVFAIVASA